MKRFYYHATAKKNEESILAEGIRKSWDGGVYLTEAEEEALRFMALRFDVNEFSVFKIDMRMLDKTKLEESFDHSEQFFKCKAFMYMDSIPVEALNRVNNYERKSK